MTHTAAFAPSRWRHARLEAVLDHGIVVEPADAALAIRDAAARAIARLGGWATLDDVARLVVAERGDPGADYGAEFRRLRAEVYEAVYHAVLRADPRFVHRSAKGGGEFGLR